MLKKIAAAAVLCLCCVLPAWANSQTNSAGFGSGQLAVQVIPTLAVDWWADPAPRKYCTWSIILDWDEDFAVGKYQFRFSRSNARESKWSPVYDEASSPHVLLGLKPWDNGNTKGSWIDHPWGATWRNASPQWLNSGGASTVRINHLGDNQKINIRVRALNAKGKVMYKSSLVRARLGRSADEEVAHPHLNASCHES